MKIILVGLPYFTSHLNEKLSTAYPEHQFMALDTYYNKKDKTRYLKEILTADVLHSINGTIEKSMVIELALKLKKKVIMHWVGTDLLQAEKAFAEGKFKAQFIEKPIHLTDTPWFVERLKKLNIAQAEFIPLKGFPAELQPSSLPQHFSVLCYLPENRAEFYGIQQAIEIATALPDVTFNWVGIENWKHNLPANIHMHGWIDNMSEFIRNTVVSLRMPQADGLSFFVLENLYQGRYVAYNQNFEHSYTSVSTEDFVQYIRKLKDRFEAEQLEANHTGAQAVQEQFAEKKVYSKIIAKYLS